MQHNDFDSDFRYERYFEKFTITYVKNKRDFFIKIDEDISLTLKDLELLNKAVESFKLFMKDRKFK